MPLKVKKKSISTPLDTAKRVVTRKQEEEYIMSDSTAWRGSILHRLQIDDLISIQFYKRNWKMGDLKNMNKILI